MNASHRPASVTYKHLLAKAELYQAIIPDSLQQLEALCRDEIPKTLLRRIKHGEPYLEKAEVQSLLNWKL